MHVIIDFLKTLRGKVRHLAFGNLSFEHQDLELKIDKNRFFLGKIYTNLLKNLKFREISEIEFQVYSQFGEDGIIQYLVNNINIKNKTFVEIGCGNFEESNTRFLLENNGWRGLIIDKEQEHEKFLSGKGKYLKYAFPINLLVKEIDPINVNAEIKKAGFLGDIGLLSIDIDGIDYYVLEKINVVSPRIIVVEYNGTFGIMEPVAVVYKKNFDRYREHFSGLYFGASLRAYYDLLIKDYIFFGCNSAGNNAFFIRRDVSKKIKGRDIKEGYVDSRFRESMDINKNLTFANSREERIKLIKKMKVLNLRSKKLLKCSDL